MGLNTVCGPGRISLKTGVYLAVSEATWITPIGRREIERFWMNEYPEIDMAAARIRILEDHGFSLTGCFQLDPASWIDHYYHRCLKRVRILPRNDRVIPEAARRVVDNTTRPRSTCTRSIRITTATGFYIARKCR